MASRLCRASCPTLVRSSMKPIFLAALLTVSATALAGEDSTDHWGPGGTGPAWYQTRCGLAGFTGPSDDNRRPCTSSGREDVEVFTPGAAPSKERYAGTRSSKPQARSDA